MLPGPDALALLQDDEGVAQSLSTARDDIDAVLWRRDVRAAAAEVAAESVARGARDSAVIDGADLVAVEDSPMGRVLSAAQRTTAEVPSQVETWRAAPLQVLAHLHIVAGIGFVDSEELGRPRMGGIADDPLHIGQLPDAVAPDLVALARWLVQSEALPALLVAAVVHGELMHLRPFAWGSGLVARASVRCVLAARGLDPSLFTIPELGMLEQGRAAYVAAVRGYARGDVAGLADYLRWFTTAISMGARGVTLS